MVGIAGIQAQGKALALGVLYAEDHDAIQRYRPIQEDGDPGKPRNCRRGASYSGGIGTASASISAWSPFHRPALPSELLVTVCALFPDRSHVCEQHCEHATNPRHPLLPSFRCIARSAADSCTAISDDLCPLRRACPTCSGTGNHEGSRLFRLGTGYRKAFTRSRAAVDR